MWLNRLASVLRAEKLGASSLHQLRPNPSLELSRVYNHWSLPWLYGFESPFSLRSFTLPCPRLARLADHERRDPQGDA